MGPHLILLCRMQMGHKRFTPKGLHNTAQGCREAATLGKGRHPRRSTPKGLQSVGTFRLCNPFGAGLPRWS